MMPKRISLLLLALLAVYQAAGEEDESLQTAESSQVSSSTSTTTQLPQSAAATLGTLFRQARSERYYDRLGEETAAASPAGAAARVDPFERDPAYFEARCLTCDPNKAAAVAPVADREPYPDRAAWRQRGSKYEPSYYDDDRDLMDERNRRYRDRYEGSSYYDRPGDRGRNPGYDYDRYDPYAGGRNELFRPSYDRYDPYDRDRYYPSRPDDRPVSRPGLDRPGPPERPVVDPRDPLRAYDPRSYDNRGNGYDNLNSERYPYNDDRYNDNRGYYPAPPPRGRPGYEEYGPPRYDTRYNGRNYGRYDRPSGYDRYDPYDYERNYGRRPLSYDDGYGRGYGSRGPAPADSGRGYYGGGGSWSAGGGSDRPAYASAWNYNGGNRDSWRDVNRDRDRDRDRDRERDRDSAFYRPREYWYDSTAAPGGSRGTSFLYDRTESTTKPDSDKATSSPQTQDNNKTSYKD